MRLSVPPLPAVNAPTAVYVPPAVVERTRRYSVHVSVEATAVVTVPPEQTDVVVVNDLSVGVEKTVKLPFVTA